MENNFKKKRFCLDCNKDISNLHHKRNRCNICKEEFRKEYKNNYNKNYWKDKPKSARANKRYYQFYKTIENMTKDELNFLFWKYKHQMIYLKKNPDKIKENRTILKIIADLYEEKFKEKFLSVCNNKYN